MSLQRVIITPPSPGLDMCARLGLPASTLVRGGNLLYVSGLMAVDPVSGLRVHGTTASETRLILENLAALLEAAGSSLSNVVKVNVLLASMLEATNMNKVYAEFFPAAPPARTVCGALLPDGARVVIECTALSVASASEATKGRVAAPITRARIEPANPNLNVSRNANLPHVPGIRAGGLLFLSGMGPVAPETGELAHGPIGEQVHLTLSNVAHMLESAGSSLDRVLRVHVVLADIADMGEMDRVYRDVFKVDPPARTAWSMQLRFGNGCEIECLALA